jgi:hypothetical protein
MISATTISPLNKRILDGAPSFVGLLDTYPNAAAAYSLRLLNSNYTGALVEIAGYTTTPTFVENRAFLPDANNKLSLTSQDVGLTTTLGDWITANSITDGYVRTWYDQSGNGRNTTQTTLSSQPQILISSDIYQLNGKPTMYFINKKLTNNSITSANVQTLLAVGLFENTNARLFTFNNSTSGIRNTLGNTLTVNGSSNVSIYTGTLALGQLLVQAYGVDPVTTFYNNNAGGVGNQGNYSGSDFTIGNGSTDLKGHIQEIILYNSNEVSNRVGIQSNINTYYSIY